jgi:uncharacterized protein
VPVDLTLARVAAIAGAGCAAGCINAIVGSGTLISFPTLVGIGFDRIPANIANTIGLTPGSASAASAQRRELVGQTSRLRRLVPFSVAGSALGASLVLLLSPKVFQRVVPFLVLVGVVLVAVQPKLQARLRARRTGHEASSEREHHSVGLRAAVFATGMYGGYFGAGQGVILMGVLGSMIDDALPRLNATKNVLAGFANGTAASIFIVRGLGFRGSVPWAAAAIVAGSSIVGGQLGARVSRRIPANILRALIIIVGVTVAVRMILAF